MVSYVRLRLEQGLKFVQSLFALDLDTLKKVQSTSGIPFAAYECTASEGGYIASIEDGLEDALNELDGEGIHYACA